MAQMATTKAPSAPMTDAQYDKDLKALQAELKGQRKYKLTIPSTKDETQPVDVIINGHNFIIKRDTEVVVPEAVIEILRNAMIDGLRFDPELNKNVPHKYLRFPFMAEPV